MPAEILPTAKGDLVRTPFAHLLVYAIDQVLTGALFLHEPSGVTHSVRFERGRCVKVQMGDGYARLGDMLIDAGVIDQQTHDEALTVPGLLGDALLVSGRVERDKLEKVVRRQFVMRMTRLFGLPANTQYSYFADLNELVDDRAPLSVVHPLEVLWAGLREHAAKSTMMPATLERLGKKVLRVHPAAPIDRIAATADERAFVEKLRRQPQTMAEIVETNSADVVRIRWMVYGLVIMRFIDFGSGMPLFAEAPPPRPPMSTNPVALARIRLQSSAGRRFQGAAPDDVGDGERIRPQPRMLKRSQPNDSLKVHPSEEPPSSAVIEIDPSPPPVRKRLASCVETNTSSLQSDPPPSMQMPPEGQPDAERPAHALYCLATRRLAENDISGALAACQLAREIDDAQPDYAVLAIWIRAIRGGADLSACVADLDSVLQRHPTHAHGLFLRGYLRRRVGDDAGALLDLRRSLELEPTHTEAARELRRHQLRTPAKRPSGLYRK